MIKTCRSKISKCLTCIFRENDIDILKFLFGKLKIKQSLLDYKGLAALG